MNHFDPYMTTIAKYNADDLAKVGGDVNELIRLFHDGEAWRRMPMPEGSRDTKNKTLTALIGSFSSKDDCAIGH